MAATSIRRFSFVFFIALCVAAAALSAVSWKIDPRSGQHGTTNAGTFTLAAFDLEAGDSIHYDYEANYYCRFMITTDPLNPVLGQKLLLAETHSIGWYDCSVEGRYFVQILFMEVPDGVVATVDYEVYAVDDTSSVMMIAKPVGLALFTAILATMAAIQWRIARGTLSGGKPATSQSYWEFFASKIGNWIAIIAGAAMLLAASVIDSVGLATSSSGVLAWLREIGLAFLGIGLFMGIIYTWSEYRRTVLQDALRKG